jgi:threonine synthase
MRALALFALLLPALLAGCDRPTEAECKKAISNVQRIYGIDVEKDAANANAAVRRCRSRTKHSEVQCLINAKTAADEEACHPAAKGK